VDEDRDYAIHTDVQYGPLELIDVPALAAQVKHAWFNQSLCQVNDCVVRIGVFEPGEFHWHRHDHEDELFFVLGGELAVDLKDGGVTLGSQQGYLVPRGVEHRTRALGRTVVLMIEAASVIPTGD